MTDSEFQVLAERALATIEQAVDELDTDIEVSRSGNVLTLELDDGARVVVNSQAPMQQMWVAAKAGAHHFAWDGMQWRDTRDGSEFFATLSRLISSPGSAAVVLKPEQVRR
ncbi:MAG: iron donor protein CyaY [Burkholderiaceae bacterium]